MVALGHSLVAVLVVWQAGECPPLCEVHDVVDG
jgi:hypothetical protein